MTPAEYIKYCKSRISDYKAIPEKKMKELDEVWNEFTISEQKFCSDQIGKVPKELKKA